MKSKEEILDKNYQCSTSARKRLLACMEEYHQERMREGQDPYSSIINAESYVDKYLASRPDSKVTDMMIDKYFECYANSKCYIEGAKALRDNKIK
ncbi:MAG TPA: hypothetical protein DDW27_12520 [Bacteroidales bacterium]|nr:hypothetical protein [Bacteroidales bacterium]